MDLKIKTAIIAGFLIIFWSVAGALEAPVVGKSTPRTTFTPKIVPVDPKPTEMALNDKITPNNIYETICDGDGGWSTADVRPSSSVTGKIKRDMMKAIGTELPASAFQLDHLVSLTLGGHPTSTNLWLQPIVEAHKKDRYEKYLWKQVCSGEVGLREAQDRIFSNWEYYYLEAGLNKLGGIEVVTDEDDE